MNHEDQYVCCFGEVLWDLLPSGKVIGGAPFNVAAHLNNLGVVTYFMSRVGNDELGNEIKEWLGQKNMTVEWIQTDETTPTGIVKVTLTDQHQASYEIVSPAAWDFIAVNDEMRKLVKNSRAIIFGSLACRHAVTHNTLLSLLQEAPLKIFDVNLRTPYFSKELVESLLQKADIVKMNEEELHIIASWHGLAGASEMEKMNFVKKNFSLQATIVTKGGDGALVLNDENYYQTAGFKVVVADTVGSGDSFLAGFLKNYLSGKPTGESLMYASALGALVATHRGANPSIREEEIFNLMSTQKKTN